MDKSSVFKKLGLLCSKVNLTTVVWTFGIALMLILVIYSFMATPIADVWYYYNKYTDSIGHGGMANYIWESLHHTGRVLQWIIVYVGFMFFKMQAVKIVPILLLIGLFGALFWLFKQLKLFQDKQENLRVAGLSLLITAASIMLLPSFFDSLLWLDAAAVYLGGLVMLVLNLNFLYILLFKKPAFITKIGIFVAMALGQTLSEPMSALMIGLTLLGTVVMIIARYRKRAITFAMSLGSLIAGFALLYLSPGSTSRRHTAMPGFDPHWVFADSINGFYNMTAEWKWWVMLLPIIIIVVMLFVSIQHIRLKARYTLLIALGIFAATTYPIFVMNNYSQNYIPHRVMTLPVFGVIAACMVLGVFLAQIGSKFLQRNRQIFVMTCIAWIVLCMPAIMLMSVRNMEKLSLREKFIQTRNGQVEAQVREGARPIRIMVTPNLLRSNAEDFTYDDGPYSKGGRGWVANSYLKFKGIDENLPKEAVDLMNPPEFYQ